MYKVQKIKGRQVFDKRGVLSSKVDYNKSERVNESIFLDLQQKLRAEKE